MENKTKKIIITITIFLITIVFGGSFGNLFFGDLNYIDEGQFGGWVNHMIHGEKMYKDIYITYGPFLVYPLYILAKLFGPSAELIRLYLKVGSAISVVAIYALVSKLYLHKTTKIIIITLLIIFPSLVLRHAFGFATLLAIFYGKKNSSKLWHLFTGIFASITFLVSPDIGIIAITIMLAYYFFTLLIEIKFIKAFKNTLTVLLGCIIIWTPFIIWSSYEGWFINYVDTTYDVIVSLSGKESPIGQNFPDIISLLKNTTDIKSLITVIISKEALLYWGIFFYIIIFFYLFCKFVFYKITETEIFISLISFFGIFLYSILIGRSGVGHFFFTLAPLFIILGYFVEQLFIHLYSTKSIYHKIISVCLLIIFLLFTARLGHIIKYQIVDNATVPLHFFKKSSFIERVGYISISKSQKEEIEELQKYIKKHTTVNDYIFFLNDEPMMYMLVDRVNPARYDLPFIATTKEKRLEILSSLNKNQPKYILENTNAWAVDGIPNRVRLPEINKYINKYYIQCDKIGNIIIYCKKKI